MDNNRKTIQNIAADELDIYIKHNGGKCILVDVRDKVKFNKKHINRALNIYYKDIMADREQLPKDKEIILYCDRGGVSMLVAKYLSEQGYMVKNVVGGIKGYIEKNKK